jgi:hypothetical protein
MIDWDASGLQWQHASDSGQVRQIRELRDRTTDGREASTHLPLRKSPIRWITSTPFGTRLSLQLTLDPSHLFKSIYIHQLLPTDIPARHLIGAERALMPLQLFHSIRTQPNPAPVIVGYRQRIALPHTPICRAN